MIMIKDPYEREIESFYKEQIEWYNHEIEWYNHEIEWLSEQIKREKYEGGYSLQGESYIKERAKYYRIRKQYKLNVNKYEKLLMKMA